MKKIKLGDIATLITKGTTPTSVGYKFEKEGIKFVKIESISEIGNFLENKFNYISKECNNKLKRSKLCENDILFSIAGAIGKVAVVNKEILPANTNQALAIIRIGDSYNKRFLKYILNSNYIKKQYNKKKQGVAQLNLSLKDISELEIPIINLSKQKGIVDKLDKVEKLISINKKQIELLDELINSKFIEMFGNPILNEKSWETVKVIDVCECMVPERDKPKTFTGDIAWITIEDLIINGVTYKSKKLLGLTENEINEVNRKKIPKGSVIMSCVGNLGICSIAGEEMVINQQLHSFQCSNKINNYYLMYILGERKAYMNKNANNTTVAYMNKTVCNSIPIFLPPIQLQNNFAYIVKKINKQKLNYQTNLEKAQELMNTLMNQYFN